MRALLINDYELEEEIVESLSKLRMQRNSVVHPEKNGYRLFEYSVINKLYL